ncbi:hypothetical protein CYY_000791 [Polysphondylium violaceum]|uniref:Uncharacterized protein n=1 Tax=Polysphondylium violaceum TaxID=133409 RepID=A0A8J4PZ70_9MYCE|nr:hypothetical protein CYY_000791 [Polysphondylium violaceum]
MDKIFLLLPPQIDPHSLTIDQIATNEIIRDMKIQIGISIPTIVIMLAKFFYLQYIEKSNASGAFLKKAVHIMNASYLTLITIFECCVIEGSANAVKLMKFRCFGEIMSGLFCVASVILIFLHWIGMVQNVFKINNGAILTTQTKAIFFGVFLIPNLLTSIVYLGMFYNEDFLDAESSYFPGFTEFYYYFLFSSVAFIIFILWTFLTFQIFKINSTSRGQIKRFFIAAYLVSTTALIIAICKVINFNRPDIYCFSWLLYGFIILFQFEVIFLVYPVNHHKIRHFFDSSYPLPLDPFSPPTKSMNSCDKSLGSEKSHITIDEKSLGVAAA